MEQIFYPLKDSSRLAIIDVLRGWALLGVVLMNYTDVYYFLGVPPHPNGFDNVLIQIGKYFFEAKSWTLLSFLFGYGFAVLIDNLSSKKMNPVPFFIGRMFWLLVFAAVNTAFWFGDILKDYAVMGLILLLFYKCSAKTAFYISLGLLLINPFVVSFCSNDSSWFPMAQKYFQLFQSHNPADIITSGFFATYYFEMANKFYLIACHETIFLCFMLGLAAQKINFFGRLSENKPYIKRIFWITLCISIVLDVSLTIIFKTYPKSAVASVLKVYNIWSFPILSSMLCIASGICWLFLSGKLKGLFSAFQVYGRMTLTNYITQSILGVLIFSGIGLRVGSYGLSYGAYMLIALAIYIVQIQVSRWWLARYYYGPLEWVWRQLSYRKRLPLKIKPNDMQVVTEQA